MLKANFFEKDFLISKDKKAFILLQKAFIETPIFHHFNPECDIWIETDTLGYSIGAVENQMTLKQHSFNHTTLKDLNSSKSEIGQ